MAEAVLFWGVAIFAVVSAMGVVFSPKPAHAVLSLLCVMLAIAVAFYAIGSPVLAAMQLIIYAGAVIVLFLFVVMLLDLDVILPSLRGARLQLAVVGVASALLFTLVTVALLTGSALPAGQAMSAEMAARPPIERLGLALYRDHLPLLLLIAVLLTAAADGVVGLTRRRGDA